MAILLAFIMAFGLLPTSVMAADNNEYASVENFYIEIAATTPAALDAVIPASTITVYVSFEGYTIGHGFFIEPTAITLPIGSTGEDATRALLTQKGHTYDYSTAWGFALDRVHNFNAGTAYLMDVIMEWFTTEPWRDWGMPFDWQDLWNPAGSADGSLGSGDYFMFSGWMFTVNHHLTGFGADAVTLNDGDVIRWQFALAIGDDLGLGPEFGGWGEPLYTHANKTEVIRALFETGATQEAIQLALAVIIDPMATAADVTHVLALLTSQTPPPTDRTALNTAVTEAEARQQANYTAESWAALQNALTAAQILSANATQSAIDQTTKRLQNALDALVLRSELPAWRVAMDGALHWLYATTPNPAYDSEWAIIALARAGIDVSAWYDSYLQALRNTLTAGDGPSIITDYARVALALTALGEDASNFHGHNLIAPFVNVPTTPRTINADIFALLALNSRPYSGAQEQYITTILAAERNPGWGLMATIDVDITAMAIQALAPYYNSRADVREAINRALVWLNSQHITDAEGNAQVIIALSALGRAEEVTPFVNALLAFYDPATGGFLRYETVDSMSTAQATLALVAYDRMLANKNSLFDMRDAARGNIPLPPPPDNGVNQPPGGGGTQPPIITQDSAFISVRNDQAGRVFFEGYFYLYQGETALSLLQRTGLSLSLRGSYVVSIAGLAEFDEGPGSGWMFRVNGAFPQAAATAVPIRDGAIVEWLFTRDLGHDIGGGVDGPPGPGVVLPPIVEDEDEEYDEEIELIIINGAAIAEITPDMIQSLISEADSSTITITLAQIEDVSRVEIDLTVGSVRDIVQNEMSLAIQSDIATLVFDNTTLASLVQDEDDDIPIRIIIEIIEEDSKTVLTPAQQAIIGDNLAISITVMVGERIVRNFAGTVTVSIPFVPPFGFLSTDRDLLTVYHIDITGNAREMLDARFYNFKISFTTNHFSVFFVSEWISPFVDVARNDWFFRSVRFTYVNNLMSGTAAGVFSPNAELSRAMIVTLLWNLEGQPITTASNNFTDVQAGQWYYNAVNWASENGIVLGLGDDRFAPNDNATREQFAVILQNYARFNGISALGGSFATAFEDEDTVSAWALDAMQWANTVGLISGRTVTTLVPRGTATRAEAAVILQGFVENLLENLTQ